MTVPYDERDNAIMANNIFHQLCEMDEEDRRNGKDPQWIALTPLAERLLAIDDRIDVAYIAEATLLDELGYMERDPHNDNVRLTQLGRQNCPNGIEIPPSLSKWRHWQRRIN